MDINTLNFKPMILNIQNHIVAHPIAIATLATGIFYKAVDNKYRNDFDVFPEGKFSVVNTACNAMLLAAPGFARYLLSPTHLDKYIPSNARDLLVAGACVCIMHLVIAAVKKVWEYYDRPMIMLVNDRYMRKLESIDVKLLYIQNKLMAMDGVGLEGGERSPRKIHAVRLGEITPPKEDLSISINEGVEQNPGNTPRVAPYEP